MRTILFALLLLISINALFAQTILIKQTDGTYLEISYDNKVEISFLVNTPCFEAPTVVYAGKTYNTIQIGSQCWLKENLNVGTRIDGGINQTSGNGIEKYCYFDNDANCTIYGGLYQWNEAMNYSASGSNVQGICPSGWHIPTKTEFETLKAAVGNDGNRLKAVGQGTGSGAGTNTSGFSALLAGFRNGSGLFANLSNNTYFWSSIEYDATLAYNPNMGGSSSSITLSSYNKEDGFSVRCLKN
ncbi:MAG: FISUMP domain-containing protein [bacterium]